MIGFHIHLKDYGADLGLQTVPSFFQEKKKKKKKTSWLEHTIKKK